MGTLPKAMLEQSIIVNRRQETADYNEASLTKEELSNLRGLRTFRAGKRLSAARKEQGKQLH